MANRNDNFIRPVTTGRSAASGNSAGTSRSAAGQSGASRIASADGQSGRGGLAGSGGRSGQARRSRSLRDTVPAVNPIAAPTRGQLGDLPSVSARQQPSDAQAPRTGRNAQVTGASRAGSRQAGSVQTSGGAHNLWDIGDNPSPDSGFAYQKTRQQPGAGTRRKPTVRSTRTSQPEQAAAVRPESASLDGEAELTSERIGDIREQERAKRLRASSRRYFLRIIVVVGVVVALVAGWAAFYNSPVFSIENVEVNGVEHLTADEMTQLASVPADTTLLRVDTDAIAERLRVNSWVKDVQINRVFPNTLEINVTERPVVAIVEIPVSQGSTIKQWAIADDHTWLMPIPDAGSDAAKTTSAKIYEDAATVRHIVDVPYGTKAEIGQVCTDENVNNALDILGGMTTELVDKVVKVSAAGPAETTLLLDNGVEIAFGKAEDIRDKERVIEKILEENSSGVAYINVRMVENPTWRAI